MKKIIVFLLISGAVFGNVDFAKAYFADKSSFINLNYAFTDADDQYVAYDMHNLRLDLLNRRSAFLHGLGLQGGRATDGYGAELYYNVLVHISEVGEKPLAIAQTIPLIPYLGLQVGVGFHQFTYDGHHYWRFTNSKSEGDKFFHNFMVFRSILGIKFPVNKDIALDINGAKDYTHERALSLGLGACFKF